MEGPLVLLGENNAGKSNLTRAIDMVFGERWPGTITLDDDDFHGREPDGIAVAIHASVEGLPCPYACTGQVTHIRWIYDPSNPQQNGDAINYSMSCSACNKTYMNRKARSSLFSMSVDADRRLAYQLSYASKFTLLSRLMHRFHERLVSDPGRKTRLEGLFSSLVDEFGNVPEFSEFRELLATTAGDLGQNLSYRLDIDFSAYDPSNFFRSLRVHPILGGGVRSFDELGTGQEQILALAFSLAYAQAFSQSDGLVLVVDEPESHLHPLAQQWLASRLNQLATEGLQVVLTTHSPYFVDRLLARGADPVRTTVDSVGSFYEAAATSELRSALFSRACVLVEGATEALGIPVYCIFDTDSNKSGADAQSLLVKRRDLLSAIEVDASQAESNFEQAMSAVLGTSWDSVYADTMGAQAITQLADALRAVTGEDPADGPGADDDEWDSEVNYDDIPDDAWDEARNISVLSRAASWNRRCAPPHHGSTA